MRWLMAAMALALALAPHSASALIITPDSFNASLSHNTTYKNHFRITPENLSTHITITHSSPFEVDLSATELDISTYYDLDFSIWVPEYFIEGAYQSYIFINAGNESQFVTIDISVEGDRKYISDASVNVSAISGGTGFFLFGIEDIGNDIIEVEFDPSIGVGELTTATSTLKLYPGVKFEVPFVFTIDEDVSPDTYHGTISVTHDNETKSIPVYIAVTDGQSPEVTGLGFEGIEGNDIEAGIDQEFWAKCEDNIKVTKARVSVVLDDFNDTYGMSESDGLWRTEFAIKEVGDAEITVYCEDAAGNVGTKTMVRDYVQVQGCEVSDISFYSIQKGKSILNRILDCEHEIPVSVTLKSFEYLPTEDENNSVFTFFLDDDSETYDLLDDNETFDFDEVSTLRVGLKANGTGSYRGKLKLNFPSWAHDDVTLEFQGNIGDLTIPEDYSRYVGEDLLTCKPDIKDEEEDSEWTCSMRFPIDTPLDQLGKIVTPEDYEEIKSQCDDDLNDKDKIIGQSRFEAGLFLTMIILAGLWFGYTYVFSNSRLSHNKNRPMVLIKRK